MSNPTELLRRALEALDQNEVEPMTLLQEDIRAFLEVEKQYDVLSDHYVEGLSNSMKAYKEYFEREEERVMELFAAEPEVVPERGPMTEEEELLTLAAKAAGYNLEEHYDDDQYYPWCAETEAFWNPLLDDGDALRLAVMLKLNVMFWAVCLSVDDRPLEMYENDPYAATRRAIVKAAAEIGREME